MKSKKPILVATILASCCLSSILFGAEKNQWSMELRIAAHPDKDKLIIGKAISSQKSRLYEDERLIAKWVPVLQNRDAEILESRQLVTRRNEDGQVELLVLVDANAITEEHIIRISSGKDSLGRLALDVQLDSAGGTKLKYLTQNNLSTSSCTRHLAEIIDGEVYAAPKILATVREHFQISADFTETMIDEIAKRAGNKVIRTYPSLLLYSITVTPLRIIIFLIVLFLLIFGCIPARGLRESNHPRSWIAFGIVVGILIGGYLLGVTKTTGSPNVQNGIPPWGQLIHISILGVLSGSVIGGIFGIAGGHLLRFIVRRAVHNVSVTIGKSFSSKR